jgi:hypothetical protein
MPLCFEERAFQQSNQVKYLGTPELWGFLQEIMGRIVPDTLGP